MHLPIKAHYATVAMLALAHEHEQGQPKSLREIADSQDIPLPFLTQIVQQLRSMGLVSSSRGSSGGYRLTRSPHLITIAEIIEAVCPKTHSIPEANLQTARLQRSVAKIWDRADDVLEDYLQGISLQELVEQDRSISGAMFYI